MEKEINDYFFNQLEDLIELFNSNKNYIDKRKEKRKLIINLKTISNYKLMEFLNKFNDKKIKSYDIDFLETNYLINNFSNIFLDKFNFNIKLLKNAGYLDLTFKERIIDLYSNVLTFAIKHASEQNIKSFTDIYFNDFNYRKNKFNNFEKNIFKLFDDENKLELVFNEKKKDLYQFYVNEKNIYFLSKKINIHKKNSDINHLNSLIRNYFLLDKKFNDEKIKAIKFYLSFYNDKKNIIKQYNKFEYNLKFAFIQIGYNQMKKKDVNENYLLVKEFLDVIDEFVNFKGFILKTFTFKEFDICIQKEILNRLSEKDILKYKSRLHKKFNQDLIENKVLLFSVSDDLNKKTNAKKRKI